MAAMGLEAPSPAWPARIFRQEGVARAEPSKRPRAAWRRFGLPRPQRPPAGPDAGEYVLAGGRKAVIWPAPGRPLAPGGGLAGRPGRWPARRPSTSSTGAWPPGARTRRPRGRQRRGPGPQPAPSHRPARPGRVRSLGVEPPAAKAPAGPPPRARTSASARPCSATRAGSPWPTPSPSPRETGRPLRPHPATPSAPTRARPGASPPSRPRTSAKVAGGQPRDLAHQGAGVGGARAGGGRTRSVGARRRVQGASFSVVVIPAGPRRRGVRRPGGRRVSWEPCSSTRIH